MTNLTRVTIIPLFVIRWGGDDCVDEVGWNCPDGVKTVTRQNLPHYLYLGVHTIRESIPPNLSTRNFCTTFGSYAQQLKTSMYTAFVALAKCPEINEVSMSCVIENPAIRSSSPK